LIAHDQIQLTLPVKDGQPLQMLTLGKGQFLAEMFFIDGHAHTADAYAVEDVELRSIDRESLASAIGKNLFASLIQLFRHCSI
jgi:CRP-like cAMP-binding protein